MTIAVHKISAIMKIRQETFVRECDKMIVKDLFVRNENGDVIEGYLGDDKQAEILFLLREPNSGGKGADNFWFYDAIRNNIDFDKIHNPRERRTAKIAQTKYINVLRKLSQLVLKEGKEKEELLRQCAYINLYPFSGEREQSKDYVDTLDMLMHFKYNDQKIETMKIAKDSPKENIISNRLKILESIGCNYIITTGDIFKALRSSGWLKDIEEGSGFKYKNNKTFDKARIFGVEIYEFYHPCAYINKDNIRLT